MKTHIKLTLELNEVYEEVKEKLKLLKFTRTKEGLLWRNPFDMAQSLTIQAFADNSKIYHVQYEGPINSAQAIIQHLLLWFEVSIRQINFVLGSEVYTREDCRQLAKHKWLERAPYMFECDNHIHCLLMPDAAVFHTRVYTKLDKLQEVLVKCEQYSQALQQTKTFDLFTFDQFEQQSVCYV